MPLKKNFFGGIYYFYPVNVNNTKERTKTICLWIKHLPQSQSRLSVKLSKRKSSPNHQR